ncbi:MAG TPA: hydrogenase subunit MbhD domain-containing protein [Actinomycetes bacterium]
MTVLLAVVLLGVAAAGTATVLTRNPLDQAVAASFFGLLLGVLFLVLQAPDVALSQITVGAVALPLMVLLALAKIRRQEGARSRPGAGAPPERPQERR